MWLVNQRDSTSPRPNVAAVGLAAEGAAPTSSAPPVDPMGDVGAQFLDGTALAQRAVPATPAVGSSDGRVVATATAIFRRSLTDGRTCAFSGLPAGSRITVVNVDNSRSIRCTTVPRPSDQPRDELVMSAATFVEIADPTSAPINVEIRQ